MSSQQNILGKDVNWTAVSVSVIIFIGLEILRRKYISKRIKEEVGIAMSEKNNQGQAISPS
jgi:hypothetical protein